MKDGGMGVQIGVGEEERQLAGIRQRERRREGGKREKEMGLLTSSLLALNELGCTLCRTRYLRRSTLATCFWAGEPQARKTTPPQEECRRATTSMTFWVKRSRPLLAWLLAWWARTVRQVLSMSKPWSAQGVSRPVFLGGSWNESP